MTEKEMLIIQNNINKIMVERITLAIEYLQVNRSLPALQILQQIFPEIEKMANRK